ncbi:MAG TPA: uracil phosphoribosyltransferase [Acidimicrobiales bacterium]|nr:uracil phosphoribosyltransferase [Acidimicrobiales bacterium]
MNAEHGALADLAPLIVVDHPVVADRLAQLRDRDTDNFAFRRLTAELSAFVAYEALRDLETETGTVETPVATDATARRISETLLLVPILRAGLGMVPAITSMLSPVEVAHVGLRRDEETLQSNLYLDALPASLAGRKVVVCDPMLATGGTLVQVCDLIVARGAASIVVLCLLASMPGLRRFRDAHPDVLVACAGIDLVLNDSGYIVPGLGDAGDRLFGRPG